MQPVLFLDISTNLGWCCAPPDGEPRFGTVRLPSTDNNIGRLLDAFHDWLDGFLDIERPEVVGIEKPISTARTHIMTARKLLGLTGHAELVCRWHEVRCVEVQIQHIKKHLAGHGWAKKPEMVRAARRYGWQVRNDNEADACGGWMFLISSLHPAHAGRFALGPLGAGR